MWRRMKRVLGYTPVVTQQGEIGSFSVTAKYMKTKLIFASYSLNSEDLKAKNDGEILWWS